MKDQKGQFGEGGDPRIRRRELFRSSESVGAAHRPESVRAPGFDVSRPVPDHDAPLAAKFLERPAHVLGFRRMVVQAERRFEKLAQPQMLQIRLEVGTTAIRDETELPSFPAKRVERRSNAWEETALPDGQALDFMTGDSFPHLDRFPAKLGRDELGEVLERGETDPASKLLSIRQERRQAANRVKLPKPLVGREEGQFLAVHESPVHVEDRGVPFPLPWRSWRFHFCATVMRGAK